MTNPPERDPGEDLEADLKEAEREAEFEEESAAPSDTKEGERREIDWTDELTKIADALECGRYDNNDTVEDLRGLARLAALPRNDGAMDAAADDGANGTLGGK